MMFRLAQEVDSKEASDIVKEALGDSATTNTPNFPTPRGDAPSPPRFDSGTGEGVGRRSTETTPLREFDPPDPPDIPSVALPDFSPLLYVFLALIIAGLAYLIYRYRHQLAAFFRRRKSKKDKSQSEEETDFEIEKQKIRERNLSSREIWLKQASEFERVGDYRESVNCRYRALIAGLAEDEVVPLSDTITTGEYRSLVSPKTNILDEFDQASNQFERSRYGQYETNITHSQLMANLDTQIFKDSDIAGSGTAVADSVGV